MALAIDAYSSGTNGTSSSSTLTVAHTCSGSNRLLIVGVSTFAGTPSGVTYNGVAMTLAVANGAFPSVSLWYLVAPSTGTNNIVVTTSSSTDMVAGGVSFTGAAQSSPIDTTASGSNISNSGGGTPVTTSGANEYVVDMVGNNNTPASFAVAGSNTLEWVQQGNSGSNAGGMSTLPAATAGSYTPRWNAVNVFGQSVVAIQPFAAGSLPKSTFVYQAVNRAANF